ncbi:MAG: hypothetical protein Q4G13_01690 [Moraxella sp.]|nr:hypothetical protein [Moraxella sp.]
MTIVVQVGHISSEISKIANWLQSCGVAPALPSSTQKLSATELSKNIATVIAKKGVNNRLVDMMATDLLFANLAQDTWGWQTSEADWQALNYWANFDDEFRFVLVFDEPNRLFYHIDPDVSEAKLSERLLEWVSYHRQMLAFANAHPNKCLLIEGKAALHNDKALTDSLQAVLSVGIDNEMVLYQDGQAEESSPNILARLLVGEILRKHPQATRVFKELVALANVKNNPTSNTTKKLNLGELLVAVNEMQALHHAHQDSVNELLYLKKELANAQQQLAEQTLNNQKLLSHNTKVREAEQENKALLKQLHSTQESLEQQFNQNQSLQTEIEQSQQKIDEILKQKVNNDKQESALQEDNALLLNQLHAVQEELERYHNENKALKKEQYKPAPVYYGAAQRVKQDLPYRLGTKMVQAKSAKAVATLPLALAAEYRSFQQEKDKQKDLPSIDSYADSYEAERVKKHLSYKLGKVLVDGVSHPKKILGLPNEVIKEVLKFGDKKALD